MANHFRILFVVACLALSPASLAQVQGDNGKKNPEIDLEQLLQKPEVTGFDVGKIRALRTLLPARQWQPAADRSAAFGAFDSTAGGRQPHGAAQSSAPDPQQQRGLTHGYRKYSLDLNMGAALPQLKMRDWYWRNPDLSRRKLFKQTFFEGNHFGYRPIRYFQIDAGIEFAYNVAGERRLRSSIYEEEKEYSDLMIMLPFGGRGVIPLFDERLLISGGGGGSYVTNMQYGSDFADPEGICDPCSSRQGLGYYGVAQILYVFGESRRIGVGVTGRWTDARLKGGWLSNYARVGVHDAWLFAGGTLSIRF